MYKSSSKAIKRIIVKSVLKRIDKKREYRDIGYLIIFFLFEIGHVEKGLNIALRRLHGDKANGFGDVLRVLDFLLAFRFDDFAEAQLDAIETFVYATKEHSFSIKERVNAIRVRKILANGKM